MPKTKSSLISKVESLEKKYRSQPLVAKYKPKLCEIDQPSPTWNIFYKQSAAFDYSRNQLDDVRVFAVESESSSNPDEVSGVRKYIVTSLEEFWFYYKQMQVGKRHFYEVIEEDRTCHLYFDLEYSKLANFDKDPLALTSLWIQFVCDYLEKEFGVCSSRKHVVALDSSTDSKFSVHLVWHLPQTVFVNNIHVGYFVKQICKDLKDFLLAKLDAEKLSWFTQLSYAGELNSLMVTIDSNKTPAGVFVDEGVYTKNRNFRLFLSSKLSKKVELTLSTDNNFDFEPIVTTQRCCKFHTFSSSTCQGFEFEGQKLGENLSHDATKLIFFASLCSCIKLDNSRTKELQVIEVKNNFSSSNTPQKLLKHVEMISNESHLHTEQMECGKIESCIYKLISEHLKSTVPNAKIRKVSYSEDKNTIVFDISGSRYCGNIGREHKSNNVMFVANVSTKTFYQKCYDPDCRATDYKSTPNYFPQWLCSLLDFEKSNGDDELLLSIAEDFD